MSIQPQPLTPFQPGWIFLVFLGIFILLAGIKLFYPQQVRLIFRAVFSVRRPDHLIREGNLIRQGLFAAISLVYVLTMAMGIFSAMQFFFDVPPLPVSSFILYLLLALSVAGFWSVKILVMNLLSLIFKTDAINTEYMANLAFSLGVMSIIMLPCLVSAVYLKSAGFLYIASGVIVVFSVFRLLKGFIIGLSLTRFSIFFLFVYLCTLETLPLLIAAKLILTYF